jgi:hypothetical protein
VLLPFYVQGRQIPALLEPREHVRVDPGVRGGEPVISRTRIPYDEVAALLDENVPAPITSTVKTLLRRSHDVLWPGWALLSQFWGALAPWK